MTTLPTILRLATCGALGLLAAFTGACEKKSEPAPASPTTPGASAAPAAKKTITIGVIAKSESNPVFQAARTGAQDAGRELSEALAAEGVEVKIVWRTPVAEDAAVQAQYVEQLISQGVDGIAISCTNADLLTPPIDQAVGKGVVVVTFDSDAPASKRLAYYGIDDVAAGKAVMAQLAKAVGDKGGPIAILGGNQTAPNLQARIRGVRESLDTMKDKGFTLKNVYYHKETAVDGAATVQQAQTANPDIVGWAMVGGWPLFTQNALDGVADKAKVVSVDTLPEQLDYVRKGEVQALIGQDCYAWGHESVKILVDKIHHKKDPAATVIHFDLAVVTKDNVEQYAGLWEKWLGRK
ncbi:MAG: substrate-binding domain-containing protein [Planctomycetota bacterium]|nr:substrate-binding domain-containing protein [Planctomycetota bacterium]